MNYTKQAQDFATKHNVTLSFIGEPEYRYYFTDDDVKRYVFKCKLQRGKNSYTFNFGQSLRDGSKEPTMYDVLACLTKHDPETLENFCSEYGYDHDSRKAAKIYRAVCKEWGGVERLFGDILEELTEIG